MGTESDRSEHGIGRELVAGHLPLLYNIVGRALNGHPDTDDVVQETVLHAMDGLDGLREPAAFRSWLVAIAMNQVRRRHRDRQSSPAAALDEAHGLADPGSDFVGLTITRLGLSGQRREVTEATRWLDPEDGELLALWWQEAAGELSRAELAGALDLTPQHAAVRVQRMKERLATARVVVRALAATPGCPELAAATTAWDGVPAALWRKRIARHARQCPACDAHARGLVPAEGLLAGLALLPLPRSFPAGATAASGATAPPAHPSAHHPAAHHASHGGGHRPTGGHRHRAGSGSKGRGRRRVVAGVLGVLVTVTAAGLVWHGLGPAQGVADRAPGPVVGDSAAVDAVMAGLPLDVPSPAASPTASASPSPSPSLSPSHSPSPTASATLAPAPARTTAARSAAAPDYGQQVLDLVNSQRAQAGCGPLTANAKLRSAAQGQSDDMAARNFFDHTNPDGAGPQQRIDAAGYRWSTWGENIARGQSDPAAVMDSWMNSPGHRANILNCAFKELGVGVHLGTGGPWWTQDFGAP